MPKAVFLYQFYVSPHLSRVLFLFVVLKRNSPDVLQVFGRYN
jgi:hypothetical protein